MWLEIRNWYNAKIRNNQETRIAKILARGTATGAGDRVRMCTNSGATKKANGPVCGSKPLPVYNEHYQDSTFNGAPKKGWACFLQILAGIIITFPLSVIIGLIFHVFYEAANNVKLAPQAFLSELTHMYLYEQNLVKLAAVLAVCSAFILSLPLSLQQFWKSEAYLGVAELVPYTKKFYASLYHLYFVEALKKWKDRDPNFTRYGMYFPIYLFCWNLLVYVGYLIDFFYLEEAYKFNTFFGPFWELPRLVLSDNPALFVIFLTSTVLAPIFIWIVGTWLYRYLIRALTPPFRTYINFVLDQKHYSEKSRRLYSKPSKAVFLYESYRFMTRIFWFAVVPTWVLANSAFYFYDAITARRYDKKYRIEFKHMKEDIYTVWEYFLDYTKDINVLWVLTVFVIFVLFWPAFIHAPLPKFWDKNSRESWTIGGASSWFIKSILGVIFDWNTTTTYLMLWIGVFIGGMYERARVFGKYVWKDSYEFVERELYDLDEGIGLVFKSGHDEYFAANGSPYVGIRFGDPRSYNNLFHWTLEEIFYADYTLTLVLLLSVPFLFFFIAFSNYYLQWELGVWSFFLRRQRRRLVVFSRAVRVQYKGCLRDAFIGPQSIFLTYIPLVFLWFFSQTAVNPNRIYKGDSGFEGAYYSQKALLQQGYSGGFEWRHHTDLQAWNHETIARIGCHTQDFPVFSWPTSAFSTRLNRILEYDMMEVTWVTSWNRDIDVYRMTSFYGHECPEWLLWAWEPIRFHIQTTQVEHLFYLWLVFLSPLAAACFIEMTCPGSTGLNLNWYREYRLWTLRGRHIVLENRRRLWWEEKLRPVEPGSHTPDNSMTWRSWILGGKAVWYGHSEGGWYFGEFVWMPRIRSFKVIRMFVLTFVFFFWPDWCWMNIEKFVRLTFEGYWVVINCADFIMGCSLFFIAAIFGLTYSAKEFFFHRTNGIEADLYDYETCYRVIDRRHWSSKMRMVYYDIPTASKKFEGSLWSAAGIFYILGRLFWGILWSFISVWLPISLGVPVGTGIVFRPDVFYNLMQVPEITWNALCYMWSEEPFINRFIGLVIAGQTWSAFLYYNNKTFDEVINPRDQDRVLSIMDATAVQLMFYLASMWALHCGYILEETHAIVDEEFFIDAYLGDDYGPAADFPNKEEEPGELYDDLVYDLIEDIIDESDDYEDYEYEFWESLGETSVKYFDDAILWDNTEILHDQIARAKYPNTELDPWEDPNFTRKHGKFTDPHVVEKVGGKKPEPVEGVDKGYFPDIIPDMPADPQTWELMHPNETGDGYVDAHERLRDMNATSNSTPRLEDYFYKKFSSDEAYRMYPNTFDEGHPNWDKSIELGHKWMSLPGVYDYEIGELIWDEADSEHEYVDEDDEWEVQSMFERYDELIRLEHRRDYEKDTEQDMVPRYRQGEWLETFWFMEEDEFPMKWGYNPDTELQMVSYEDLIEMAEEAEEYIDEEEPLWDFDEEEWEIDEIEADEDFEDENEFLPEYIDETEWDWNPKEFDRAYYRLRRMYGRSIKDPVEDDISEKIDH